jgi:hypothetical protein
MTVLKRRLPQRAAALVAAAVVAVGLAYAFRMPARYGLADNGVIHGYAVLAEGGVIHADGIQGSGLSPRMTVWLLR